MTQKHIVAVLVFLCQGLLAQNYVDIARLYYSHSAPNTFQDSPSKTRVTEVGFDVTYPIVLKNGDAILTGFSYERTNVKLFAEGYGSIASVAIRVGINKKHSDKLSGRYLLIPKLASDFEQPSGRNFQFGALALLKFVRSERVNYKAGVYLNSEFFGPFITPILGFYYLNPNGKFEANVTLPSLVDLNYKLHNVLNIGFNFSGQIRSYRLAQLSATSKPGYVVKSSNEVCGYLKFNLSKNLSIQTRLG